ncbi:hypothetical protein GCM10007063_28810 [Lentibacillus kapialis]|uniref:Uncharacterized protein n=1 Tax=Lentibacillus kapialis TaxID=340214 RepID=A0A917Q0X9_9BACI|nr:hypothetical protein GCM10007063_28810 [Lentibacillus kapialis]
MDIIKIFYTKDERYSVLAEEIYVGSCRRKGIGETPQCEARGGPPAALRCVKYISGAM